jgi:hypothetical protein
MTEEELRAAWVTEPPKLTGKIQVVDYDPAWPELFRREAGRIRGVLEERACCWSTSGRPRCRGWPPSRSSTSC